MTLWIQAIFLLLQMTQKGFMKLYFTITCILLALISCKKDVNETAIDYGDLGGEIINPNTNYIVLSKNESIIDTVKLDGRNRFIYKIENLNEGLYTFRHGGEYQLILLEVKDSLLFRLNTLDFDESLVYSGKGDKKNNYFINEFLANEEEEKYIIKLCQLDGITFKKRVDSLKASKIKTLEHFTNKNEPSSLFLKIANANIDYSYYSSKEVYPFVHYGKNKAAILKALPENFYDYRNEINYNDEFLSSHHNYNKFLRYNLSNLSLKTHDNHDANACYDRKSLCYNLDRLKLIDSLIINPNLKDDLLYHFTMGYLSKSKNEEHNNALLKSYLEQNIPLSHISKIISEINDGVTIRVIELSLKKMDTPPPVKFSWLALGSQGRKEQLLYTDQDNALVFEDVAVDDYESTKDYFLTLSKRITAVVPKINRKEKIFSLGSDWIISKSLSTPIK